MRFLLPNFIISIILLLSLATTKLYGQDINRVQGDVLIQLSPDAIATDLVKHYQRWNGLLTGMKVDKQVSQNLDIWLFQFDFQRINEYRFLADLKRSKMVLEAQFNHIVKNRAVPNDPLFSNQWQYINDGSSGGVADADIDADEAWNITTGGLTALGDTIVACIIDDGIDADHEDMAENLWMNYGEIPNNGIDDDGNGFIDDYRGWNSFDGNDDIEDAGIGGGHGTPVAGIVGAKGNNGIGVTGVNWDIKLMIVVGGSGDEAEVLMSYDYPLSLRKKYNNSGGAEGAFVVSTNASWGIDNGDPADAPLWCAMYDSLGAHGIISCGATANAAINVDLDGDLPTACPSDYLIAVTNMDRTDTKVTGAGFGTNSIDLGAFGRDTYTPQVNGNYGPFGGTSGATPHVTGAVALLYAHPCPGFISLAKNDPEGAATLAKKYIMDGVDPNNSLSGITVTEGRLNIKNALDLLDSECDSDGCYVPFSLTANDVTVTDAVLNWGTGAESDTFNLRYRELSAATWIDIAQIDTNYYELSGLLLCTDYEFQVQAICNGVLTNFSESRVFRTEGCCEVPTGFLAEADTETTIQTEWDNLAVADSFELSYKEVGNSAWQSIITTSTESTITALQACTTYDLRIRSFCPTDTSDFSPILQVVTKGCGACIDADYCVAGANDDSFEFISNVSIADLNSSSGPSGGYDDLTSLSASLTVGTTYPISLTPDFSSFVTQEVFEVWIDFNQDGDFEDAFEKVFQSEEASSATVTGVVTVPPAAVIGSTRMRVVMQLTNPVGDPCANYDFGEVEDYCVDIMDTGDCLAPVFLTGAIDENSAELSWNALSQVDEFIVEYTNEDLTDWFAVSTTMNTILLSDLASCMVHQFRVKSICDGVEGGLSEEIELKTTGCGKCIDLPYCMSLAEDSDFEWIDSVYVNDMVNSSGNNGGYQYFESPSTSMQQGQDYSIRIVPGYEDAAFEEFCRIWIDFDQDGAFSGTELVFNSGGITAPVDAMISIPTSALDGETRMRVSMKFNEIPDACESFAFGEVEDYCINIGEPEVEPCEQPSNLVEANIANNSIDLSWSANSAAIGFDVRYRPVGATDWMGDAVVNQNYTIPNLAACTEYEYQVKTVCNIGVSDFTTSRTFMTDCSTSLFEIEDYTLSLNAFPNPFSERTIIQFQSDERSEAQMEIFNLNGQRVLSSTRLVINNGTNVIELNQLKTLSSGVYMLRVDTGKRKGMLRLLKLN